MKQEPLSLGNEKQLFIDDYVLEELSGVRRQLNQPTKHPANPILTSQEPWENVYVALYGNVIYDQERKEFQLWYSARYQPEHDPRQVNTICHATSSDGINWQRTAVNRLAHDGLQLTNAVVKGPYIGPTVFHTPDDPDPQRRYRMFVFMGDELFDDEARRTSFRCGYGVLFSPDGLSWTEYEYNPVVQGGDIATCSYDPCTGEYIAFPKVHRTDGGVFRRCVGVSTSKDFLRWGASDIILSADPEDDRRVEERVSRFRKIMSYDDPSYYSADMYGMTGFRYEGLRLGLIWFFDKTALRPDEHGGNEEGVINIQLACSRDPNPYGYWRRAGDRKDFLACGDEGSCDAGMIFTAHTVVEVGDELWFYYTGVDRGHGWEPGRNVPEPHSKIPGKGSSLNLATLRGDGFVSIDASFPGGTVVTKPLILSGQHLELNADAEHGYILTEIVDAEGKPVAGYTKEDCLPFTSDSLKERVRWKQGDNLTKLRDQPVRIAFHARTAKLYAFQFRL